MGAGKRSNPQLIEKLSYLHLTLCKKEVYNSIRSKNWCEVHLGLVVLDVRALGDTKIPGHKWATHTIRTQ